MTDLAIRKDGGVVSLEAAFDQLLSAMAVNGFLLGVHVEHVVVGEGFVFAQDDLWLPGHNERADMASFNLLFGQLRTNPEGIKTNIGIKKQTKIKKKTGRC